MSAKWEIKPEKPLTWWLLLLLPEAALGYVFAGAMLVAGGVDWGFAVVGAGMAVLFSFDLFDN
jgi:hypothetical protein